MLLNLVMADREHLLANPRYHEVAERLKDDPLYTRIWQTARGRARCVEERYALNELPFALEPKFITYERDPDRTYDFPGEERIPYGTQLVLVCKFPSILDAQNEVVELFTTDPELELADDELLTLAEIAGDSEHLSRIV